LVVCFGLIPESSGSVPSIVFYVSATTEKPPGPGFGLALPSV